MLLFDMIYNNMIYYNGIFGRTKTIQLLITRDLVKIGPDSTNENSLSDYNDVIWGFDRILKGTFMSPGLLLGHPYPF